MNCTRCQKPIAKGQPYCRTKRGPHHFKQSQCAKSPVELVDVLWACHKGHYFFSQETPVACPQCR